MNKVLSDDYESAFFKLIEDLDEGVHKIEFYKVSKDDLSPGEYRLAYGTRNHEIVQDYGYYWKPSNKNESERRDGLVQDCLKGNIKFFDLQRGGWRSFRYDQLINIEFYSNEVIELPANGTL